MYKNVHTPINYSARDKIMTPKTTREHIISLHGHVTGLKKDIASIKTNHLKHMNNDIKIEELFLG